MSELKFAIFASKILAIVISVVTVIGNALVCHVIVSLKSMKTSINYIVLNVAILDAISGFWTILYVLVNDVDGALEKPVIRIAYNHSATFADVLCKLSCWYWFVSTVTPILLIAMAYERYKAVVHPFSRMNKETKTKLKILVIIGWVSGLGYVLVDLPTCTYDVQYMICYHKQVSWINNTIYLLFLLVTQYIVPSVVIFFLYLRVICVLRKQDNALGPQAEAERARRKARKKVMWIIILVTLVFYICCAIPNIWQIGTTVSKHEIDDEELVNSILVMLLSFNSAFNPFVYFICIQSFRTGFRKVFKRGNQGDDSSLRLSVVQSSVRLENAIKVDRSVVNMPQLLSIARKTSNHN